MAESLLLQPPEIVDVEGPVVFLAGPIQGAPDWQSDATRIIHSLNSSLVIASPRKEYSEGTFFYERQVDWETHFLNRAAKYGAVMFWLARQAEEIKEAEEEFPRAYAQTSRFELGEWKVRHERDWSKLIVGIEEGFGNESYIRRRLNQDCPVVPILSSLRETCKATVRLAGR